MSEDASIEGYMLTFCEKYWLKHTNEFTIDEITKERDPELTGLGKKPGEFQMLEQIYYLF